MPVGGACDRIVRYGVKKLRLHQLVERLRRAMFVRAKIVDRLADVSEVVAHDFRFRGLRLAAGGKDRNRGSDSHGSLHYVMPTSLLSPSMNRYAAGLRCVLVIFTFFPMRRASIRPLTWAIVEFSRTIEFSISQYYSTHLLPIEVYGPT